MREIIKLLHKLIHEIEKMMDDKNRKPIKKPVAKPPKAEKPIEKPKEEPKEEEQQPIEPPKEEEKPIEPPKNIVDGYEFVHKFNQAVITEYYVGDNTGTTERIGCMGTALTENYSCASHNIPCGTKLYIPSLKGVVNITGVFEVEDTGGMSFDFDMFISNDKKGKIGKKNMDVYVLQWGNKKLTCSYTYIINYFKNNNRFEIYRASWDSYKKMNGQLIKFWKFNNEDSTLDIDNV